MEQIIFFLITIIDILEYAILARVLLSWVNIDKSAQWYQILYSVTEPIMKVFRNLIPRIGMVDISPIVAMIALEFAKSGIVRVFAGF